MSSSLGVTSPLGSPTAYAGLVAGLVRCGLPGSSIAAPIVITSPTTRVQPSIPAIRSSLIEFCADTTYPPGARYGSISFTDHSVSNDFTARNTMSYCEPSPDTSPRCRARGLTANSSSTAVTVSPSDRTVSTFSGHWSISVTS